MVKRFLRIEFVGLLTIILNSWSLVYAIPSWQYETKIAILDIGQGDSTLLQTVAGNFGLIDTGKTPTLISKLEKYIPNNAKVFDFVILTHPDLDHIGMFLELSKRYTIKNVFINKTSKSTKVIDDIKAEILAKNIENFALFDSNDFTFGEFSIDVLWPLYPSSSKDYEGNEYSISTLISVGDFDFLTLGDLGSYVEDDLVDYLPQKNIEVLKISHHGSKNSTSTQFLQKVAPKIALISSGKNSYGHPHPDVLNRLKEQNIPYMNTLKEGDLVIKLDKSGVFSIN